MEATFNYFLKLKGKHVVCQHQKKVEWETESEKRREQTKAIQKDKVIKICILSDFYRALYALISHYPLNV